MLVRDSNGTIIIISRKDCKNESVYNEKIYNIRLNYTKKYKSVFINQKTQMLNKEIQNLFTSSQILKDSSDD